MKLLALTLPTPAANLACDEALLDLCESVAGLDECGHSSDDLGILRFWEPREHFVVVGYSENVASEVNMTACAARGVPILRRCSGGGTVLQGPGCLNYSLILKIHSENITETNRYIMERHREAIQNLLRQESGADVSSARVQSSGRRDVCPTVTFDGHTDLVLDGRKFSGNSQRRKRNALLFHGTFLLGLDLSLIERLLPMPTRQPDYREQRPHRDFLTNLPLSAAAVKEALRKTWNATTPCAEVPQLPIAELVATKYANTAWIFRSPPGAATSSVGLA